MTLELRGVTKLYPGGAIGAQDVDLVVSPGEFVALFEWRDAESYEAGRLVSERTIEERILIDDPRSDLAGYDQYESVPLAMR